MVVSFARYHRSFTTHLYIVRDMRRDHPEWLQQGEVQWGGGRCVEWGSHAIPHADGHLPFRGQGRPQQLQQGRAGAHLGFRS